MAEEDPQDGTASMASLSDHDDEDDHLMRQASDLLKSLKNEISGKREKSNDPNSRLKTLDDYAYYRDAQERNANWFQSMVHLKRNIHVDDHSFMKETREKVIEFIETPRAEVCILLFVLTDMVMVIIEAIIDFVFDFGHGGEMYTNDPDHGGHATTKNDNHAESHDHSTEKESGNDTVDEDHGHQRRLRMLIRMVAKPVVRRGVQDGSRFLAGVAEDASCNIQLAYDVASGCRIVSICILFIFALEVIIKFLCAPQGFCRHFGHLLDTIVIFGSIVFEFTLHHTVGGLLVFFRCWRIVRIVHGLYEQMEYISKALETEAHLESALETVNKYKAFTQSKNLRKQWKLWKKTQTMAGELQTLETIEEHKEDGASRDIGAPPIKIGNSATADNGSSALPEKKEELSQV